MSRSKSILSQAWLHGCRYLRPKKSLKIYYRMEVLIASPIGVSSITQNELKQLGFSARVVSPALCTTQTDWPGVYELNIHLRTANRVYVQLAKSPVKNFDQLFDLVQTIDWSQYIAPYHPIVVNAQSSNSALHSVRTIQSIAHKSILVKMTCSRESKREQNDSYIPIDILIQIVNDQCTIWLNTSGDSLHKRGYREQAGDAPIQETIAAALIIQSGRDVTTDFRDPCCGSGTIAIEAAMIAANIAPGKYRDFACHFFPNSDTVVWEKVYADALAAEKIPTVRILATDIDPKMITMTYENAYNAGVVKYIIHSAKAFAYDPDFKGYIITNPPYGLRIQSDQSLMEDIVKQLQTTSG